jgi:hypothetical protein
MAAGDVITIIEDNAARKGVVFDGVDDYILVDAHAVERVAANDTTGTYSAWIYKDNLTADGCILSAGDNDSATEYLRFTVQSGLLESRLYHGGAIQWRVVQSTASLAARTWYHVALVQDGVLPKLYINGVNIAATTSTATDTTFWYDELTGCDKFAIGVLESNNTHTLDWKGAIGTVKYWSRALSAAEVLKDANGETLAN